MTAKTKLEEYHVDSTIRTLYDRKEKVYLAYVEDDYGQMVAASHGKTPRAAVKQLIKDWF